MTPLAAATGALALLTVFRLGPFLRNRGDLVFCAALTGVLATALLVPGIAESVLGGSTLAVPVVGALVMLALGLVRAAIVRAALAHRRQERAIRRGLLQTAAAMTAYCVAFVCAVLVGAMPIDGHVEHVTSNVDMGVFVFSTTISLYVIVVATQIARICLRYVPRMSSMLFRSGFTAVAVGCALAVLGMAANVLREAGVLTSVWLNAGPALGSVFEWSTAGAGVLLPVGLGLPSLARWAARWQVYERYCLLRLDRVWRRAADANLVIDMLTAPLQGVISRDPRSRLHRTLVEILDSELAAGGVLLTSSESRLVKKSEEAFHV